MGIKTLTLLISLFILPIYKVVGQKKNVKTSSSIPPQPGEKVLVAFIGTFYSGRTSSQIYAEGNWRSRLIKGFKINHDLLGNIKIKEVEIEPTLQSDFTETDMIDGCLYCILLSPAIEKLKYITDNEIPFNYYEHLISKEEIITITKIE